MYVYENCCVPTIKSSAVAIKGTTLQITVPNLTLLNGKAWNLIICQNIPEGADTLEVELLIGTTAYPVLTNLGNSLRGDMLRTRKRYTIAYGWDEPHFIVLSHNLCESVFIPTTTTEGA